MRDLTLVLVHGGATTARFWDALLPHLELPAVALDLPGRGGRPHDLATLSPDICASSVAADIEAMGGDGVVLVAHSSGGLVLPGIVERLGADRVQAIVLNAASIPPEDGCGLDCMKPRHRDGLKLAMAEAERTGTTITTPVASPESLRTSSGEELTDEQVAYISDPARSVTDSVNIYFYPVRWSTAAGIPTTYVVNIRDRPVPRDLQHEMAGRLPGPPTVVELDAGHYAAFTQPEAFAVIVHAALPAH
jgi:pimeloyl-ACP methyl ester carboxylesterase